MAVNAAEQAKQPAAEHRRWMRELQLAAKREKEWRKESEKIIKIYKGVDRPKNSFNILAANTETLRPALYASLPKPDVRRRFRDADPLGKAVSEVMERALAVSVDHYDFDECCRYDVLDALLPGRGISRVRYVPQMRPAEQAAESAEEGEETAEQGEQVEEVEYEQALCEHVDWQDFRMGYGRVWAETEWIGFRHRMQKRDVEAQFGDDVAEELKYDEDKDEPENNKKSDWDDVNTELYRTAEVWEIWDKEAKRVFFLNEHCKHLLYPPNNPQGEPPLDLERFYPIPEPLRLWEDSGSQVPTPVYKLYQDQAEELERLSKRINRVINALKIRAVYDATMKELADLTTADDNQMIPASNAAKWQAAGGIEKAIWWMPVEQAAAVLRELYTARDSCKQTIYELTGISDIVRGQTNASETLGAQQLKANYSTLRLKKMQIAVQGYIRDLIRLIAEVIGEKFAPATLAQMTGLKFPDATSKQMAMAQAQQASASGQPVPPEVQSVLMLPTWDDIKQVMSSDMLRTYRVDIETDSTVQGILQEDMTAMRDVLTGIVQFWQGAGPAVQAGAVPIEAVKAITLSIARRSKLGLEVEDALEKMKQPEATGDPRQAQAMQAAQQQTAQAMKEAQDAKMQAEAQTREANYARKDAEFAAREAKHEVDKAKFGAERTIAEKDLALQRDAIANEAQRQRLEIDRAADQAAATIDKAGSETRALDDKRSAVSERENKDAQLVDLLHGVLAANEKMLAGIEKMHGPKMIIKDKDGRPVGIAPAQA